MAKERAGDQVTCWPMFTGFGLSVTAGSWLVRLLFSRFCRRLPPSVEGAPPVAMGVVERAGDLLGGEQRVDRVVADDAAVRHVVQREVERAAEREDLVVVPDDAGGAAAVVRPLPAQADGAVREPVEPAVLAEEPELRVPADEPVDPDGQVEVVAGRPVVPDVGDLALVARSTTGRCR